ncbi:hypothetical protein ACIBP6_45370 [Nonomuraea terrae]|uniref:hypothetical protein n=1 Tax=Nonomuraea terrae TaxID=2530383 RepID=UPI0037B11AB9
MLLGSAGPLLGLLGAVPSTGDLRNRLGAYVFDLGGHRFRGAGELDFSEQALKVGFPAIDAFDRAALDLGRPRNAHRDGPPKSSGACSPASCATDRRRRSRFR